MGASSSCQIFDAFSTALQWIMMNHYGSGGMSHILDDFFFIGSRNSESCLHDLQTFMKLCSYIGVPIKYEKTTLPATEIIIYGIEVDSEKMECRLPQDKIVKIRSALQELVHCKKVTLQKLQSLIGLLNFACCVICPGRAFLRRLIDLTCGVSCPFYKIRFNGEARADINAWLNFLDSYNGKSVFLPDAWSSSDTLSFYSDASGTHGFAAVLGKNWFAYPWTETTAAFQIAIKELFPIVLALEFWGPDLKNSKVLFMTDNEAVAAVINKQSSKDKILMKLIRRLVVSALTNNIYFRAKHIPGKQNVVADRLSRLQFQEAFQIAPWLNPVPSQLADHLLQI